MNYRNACSNCMYYGDIGTDRCEGCQNWMPNEKPVDKSCMRCKYSSVHTHCEPCDSCVAGNNWKDRFEVKEGRPSRDEVFMEMAQVLAKRSVCKRKQVAAMIVKDGRPISVGYNGPPSGHPHCTECSGESCSISVHAEMNAIAFAAKNGVAINGSTLYCTLSPCINCAKVIINSGIERVVFGEYYRSKEGLDLLFEMGISYEKLGIDAQIQTKNKLLGVTEHELE